ncbi:MAG: hypothetical protein ACI9LE_000270 [Paraglaciecola sp.]
MRFGLKETGRKFARKINRTKLTGQPSQDNFTIDFADNRFGGSATAFSAFKVSAQKDLF